MGIQGYTQKQVTQIIKNRKYILPLLLFAGVLLVLVPIFVSMTHERLRRQNEFITQKMIERGMGLIRTFEAGTRTGMFTMRWGAERIQILLEETAAQPEVEYIQIVNAQGRILAHSSPDQIGKMISDLPVMGKEEGHVFPVSHRIRYKDGAPYVLEVYKRFVPMQKQFKHRGGGRHRGQKWDYSWDVKGDYDWEFKRESIGRIHGRDEMKPDLQDKSTDAPPSGAVPGDLDGRHSPDWARHHIKSLPVQYIFVGVSMEKSQQLRHRLRRETVSRSVILFLLGCAGVTALLAFQAYRNTKASLKRIRAFSNDVIENMPAGLVTLNEKMKISSMNRSAEDIFGPDLVEPFPEWIDLAGKIGESQPVLTQEMTLDQKDGNVIRIEVTVSRIFSETDAGSGFLFIFRDLTQIRELQKQVETHKRLAAIGKLAGGVAHEIRNPLSSIKGFAAYFANRYQDNETDLQTARIMEGEVERINRSITQLLEFARPMAVEQRSADIRTLVEHSLKLVEHDLKEKQIKSRTDFNVHKTQIITDPDRLNQVLLNLYMNAVQAMDAQGELAVSVTDSPDQSAVEIRVSDTGSGIEERDAGKIFDPYFTTKPTGTGLGLSIVHRIVENLGGQIRMDSQKGRGTLFVISLPLSTNTNSDEKE